MSGKTCKTCETCRWWDAFTKEEGFCCWLPPVPVMKPARTYESTSGYMRTDAASICTVRPKTDADGFCGQWKERA